MCLLICQDEVPAGSWLWHRLVGYHVIQLLLFIGRYFLFVNTWAARLAEWLISGDTVGVDVSHRIFNVECRVSPLSVKPHTVYSLMVCFPQSIRNTRQNGRFLSEMHKLV